MDDDVPKEAVLESDVGMDDEERVYEQFIATHFDDIDELAPDDPSTPPHRTTGPWFRQWEVVEEHARTCIFLGSRLNCLSTILLVLKLQARHNATNGLLDDIFHLLHDLILPVDNVMVESWKEAKKVLSSIGMAYHQIHACVNDCILFHGAHKDMDDCPVCSETQYREDMHSGVVPRKLVHWFPIIPCLQQKYR